MSEYPSKPPPSAGGGGGSGRVGRAGGQGAGAAALGAAVGHGSGGWRTCRSRSCWPTTRRCCSSPSPSPWPVPCSPRCVPVGGGVAGETALCGEQPPLFLEVVFFPICFPTSPLRCFGRYRPATLLWRSALSKYAAAEGNGWVSAWLHFPPRTAAKALLIGQ